MNNQIQYEQDLKLLGSDESLHLVISGYNAVIRRIHNWHLCGYVEVPKGTPYFNAEEDICCHGGVTYEASNIIDFPTSGHYIGFDCSHANDWSPVCRYGTYKSVAFVINELVGIICQLNKLKTEEIE